MILSAAMALAAVGDSGRDTFRAGAWEVRCTRMKETRCVSYEAVISGPVSIRLKRDSATISIDVEVQDCKRGVWSTAINPAYSGRTMNYLIRGHVVGALSACNSKLPVPALLPDDTVELLRLTDGVKN